MRKSTVFGILAILGTAGAAFLMLNNPFGGQRALVEGLAKSFSEDLQFKDFRSSTLYSHNLDRDRLDIGKTLEALFQVKPEFLDIHDYDIVKTDIDKSGDRAKTLVRTRYKVLNRSKTLQEKDVLIYWIRRHPDCPLGGSCPSGACVDEAGKTIFKSKDKNKKPSTTQPQDIEDKLTKDEAADEATDETYTCDASRETEWFMNLDSTLKSKTYRDAKDKK